MTEQHQNIDVHWVTHLSVENRVSGNHLSSAKPAADAVMQVENGVCLPTRHEHHLQRENYITLTERAIVEIPCLACLKPVVCKHIPHQYSKEMAEKSEMVLHSTIYWKWLTGLLLNKKKLKSKSQSQRTVRKSRDGKNDFYFLVLKSCCSHVPVTVKVGVWKFAVVRYCIICPPPVFLPITLPCYHQKPLNPLRI